MPSQDELDSFFHNYAPDQNKAPEIQELIAKIKQHERELKENGFVNWDRKVTLTYRRLVDICKLSYEYPNLPVSYWLSSKDWEV